MNSSEIKRGLILEGGAMRSLFTAGVIDVFMENGIDFEGTIGTSAGAGFGCNIKSKQIGRCLRYNKRFARDPRYAGFRSLILTGNIFNVDFAYHRIPDELDVFDYETYRKNPMEFYCTATDVVEGKTIYKKLDTLDKHEMTWLRATSSMPLASKVVEVDGYKLLDGGIIDSIPIRYFESIGYNRNVVVLTQPREFVKKPASIIGIMKILMRKYPAVIECMKHRHEIYNETTKYIFDKADKGEVIVICPEKPLGISRVESDPEALQRCYDAGRAAAMANLERVRNFLKK